MQRPHAHLTQLEAYHVLLEELDPVALVVHQLVALALHLHEQHVTHRVAPTVLAQQRQVGQSRAVQRQVLHKATADHGQSVPAQVEGEAFQPLLVDVVPVQWTDETSMVLDARLHETPHLLVAHPVDACEEVVDEGLPRLVEARGAEIDGFALTVVLEGEGQRQEDAVPEKKHEQIPYALSRPPTPHGVNDPPRV